MSALDSRLHAFRADLADIRLKEMIEARRYVEGDLRRIRAPLASIRASPGAHSMQTTQALMGEACRVFEAKEGWAWVQLEADGYVGYVVEDALSAEARAATHRVSVLSTFIYPAADIKAPPATAIPMNAKVAVAAAQGRFAELQSGGFVYASHLRKLEEGEPDFVAVAELFRGAPYLWGGKSAAGLDCSGLIQLALAAADMPCPRDTDMQEKALGRPLPIDVDRLKRGDLVFWKGHVGVMVNEADLLHANGHHMLVVIEPLTDAVARIKAGHGEITAIKRL